MFRSLSCLSGLLFMLSLQSSLFADTKVYQLEIGMKMHKVSKKEIHVLSINGKLPAPTLFFTEGDNAIIHVKNTLNTETSLHWHGLLVPNRQDGVSYLTTPPIKAKSSYTFQFPIIHNGTFWYHSHTGLQEQRGLYGAIVIKSKEEQIKYDEERVLVLSDWTNENPKEVLRNLKRGSEFYSIKKKNMPSLFGAIKAKSLGIYLKNEFIMMPPMDLSDVAYDTFLTNGKTIENFHDLNGKIIRLRVINAGASSYFYLNYANGPLKIISADGNDIKPYEGEKILIATAETYDFLIKVPQDGAYEFRATAQDGSGYTSTYLGKGREYQADPIPKAGIYETIHHKKMQSPKEEISKPSHDLHHGHHIIMNSNRPSVPTDDLRALNKTKSSLAKTTRIITLNLTGDMNRYLWTFNNKTLKEEDKIHIKKGERVRFILENKTMMHHPLHLHGHFFRVLNQYGDFSPLKHTVDLAPHQRRIIEFEANEEKDWFFHCHILYHMKSGMARIVSYQNSQSDPDIKVLRKKLYKDPLYAWGELALLSQEIEGFIQFSNTRNDFITKWKSDYHGDFEINSVWSRYLNRYLSLYGGIEGDRDAFTGIFGSQFLLPFLIKAEIQIDTKAEFTFALEKELTLLPRWHLFGKVEYDTKDMWEWELGTQVVLNQRFSLIAKYHNDYGWGAGLNWKF